MFQANENGFFMGFANGYKISVNWDSPSAGGFYCVMNDEGVCVGAEVAVFGPNDKFVRLGECDDVIGRQSSEQVAALIAKYSTI